MAVTKATTVSGTYAAGDIRSVTIERRMVSVETKPHVFEGKPKLFASAKLDLADGSDGDGIEVEIDAARLKKVLTDSGLAALIVAEANKKLGA